MQAQHHHTTCTRRAFLSTALLGTTALLAGCSRASHIGSAGSSAASSNTVKVTTLDAAKKSITVEVPAHAKRLAVLDMAALDIIDALGLGDNVVGCTTTYLDYLKKYEESQDIKKLGTIQEADLEAVVACEPDIIFINPRLAKSYDKFAAIAPVIFMAVDTTKGTVESTLNNAMTVAQIYGIEDKATQAMSGFGDRLQAIKDTAGGQDALVTLYTSGGINVLGNDGRCSLIGNEAGFNNLAAGEVTATHGNEASFETLVAKDPAWLFVLNRDAAIGADGAGQAQDAVENDLVKQGRAYKDGHVVYLAHPGAWYTAEGGLQALDLMISDLEAPLA